MNQKILELREEAEKQLKPALDWYQAREPREQLVLRAIAGTIALLMVVTLIWMPAWQVRDNEISEWQAQAKLLAWMQSNESTIRQRQSSTGQKRVGSSGDWIAGLTRSASGAAVTLKSYNPEGEDSARIQLENQAFSATYLWLQQLSEDGIQVVSAEFMPGSEPGRINLRATLRRGL